MFRAHHHAGRVVWCAPRFTLSPNPPTLISTLVGFRVYLPPCPPSKGGLFCHELTCRSVFLIRLYSVTLHERVLDPWVYPLPAPLDGLHHLVDMQFNPSIGLWHASEGKAPVTHKSVGLKTTKHKLHA